VQQRHRRWAFEPSDGPGGGSFGRVGGARRARNGGEPEEVPLLGAETLGQG